MSEELLDFTIVTASYNYAEYIDEMLASVAAQEGVTFEHIIYDAGSTDGSIEIIKKYSHVDLTVEADSGMSNAINKGFKRAGGKWVMWLNTDDRLKPGALLAVKRFAEQNTQADVIYGAWDFVDKAGRFLRTMGVFPLQKLMLCHVGCYIGSTAAFYRNETTIGEGLILNERMKCNMDGEYYNRLVSMDKTFTHFPCVLADFRMHGGNLSQKYICRADFESILTRQLQYAESVALRRKYGITLFKSDHLNAVVDCGLSYLLRAVKVVLRRVHKANQIVEHLR